MLWRSDTNRVIIFYEDGDWIELLDQWNGVDPVPSRGSPPGGRFAPERGFGYIWGTHDEVANRLGWALQEERGFCANIQPFESGFIFHSSQVEFCQDNLYNWATNPAFTPLFLAVKADATWLRY